MNRDAYEHDCEELRVWSGALPAILDAPARPFNGVVLSEAVKRYARAVFFADGAQAAYEAVCECVPRGTQTEGAQWA